MICQRSGCGRDAAFVPKICVPARPGGPARLSPVLSIPLCGLHVETAYADDFLEGRAGEGLRQAIALMAQGRFLPDFGAAWVEGVAIGSTEHAQAMAALGRVGA